MKPILRSSAALLLCLSLAGCLPGLLGAGGLGSAQVTYGVASGDTAGFDLSAFSSRYVSAALTGNQLQITLSEGDRGRTLQVSVAQPGADTLSCPLTTGSRFGVAPGVLCSLYYLQPTGPGAPPIEASVVTGTLTLSEHTGESVRFALEATLQSPTGGSFTLRANGESLIQQQ